MVDTEFINFKREDFETWVSAPQVMEEQSLPILARLYDLYPYSSVISFLLIKNLKNLDRPLYNILLPKISSSVFDRTVLYNFINNVENNSTTNENTFYESITLPKEENKDLKELEKAYITESIQQQYFNYTQDEIDLINLNTEKQNQSKIETSETKSFSNWLEDFGNEIIQQKPQKKSMVLNFLKSAAKREKTAFYSASTMAQKSLVSDDNLVTETLAKIYESQKNYTKAITAYEKLLLLFPEKKTYFAKKIQDLKDK